MPSKTLRCPWILRALISLKSVIMTNVLKITVKCSEGSAPISAPRPESILRKTSPVKPSKRLAFAEVEIGVVDQWKAE